MLSRAATRTTTSLVTRRGFHATRARMSSPYHYPEGPYTNIPFNPRSKWFGVGYWTFMATGFLSPFGIAGACFFFMMVDWSIGHESYSLTWEHSLANLPHSCLNHRYEFEISRLVLAGWNWVDKWTVMGMGRIDFIAVSSTIL